jgi:glutaminyl-peptide cyclotransferase
MKKFRIAINTILTLLLLTTVIIIIVVFYPNQNPSFSGKNAYQYAKEIMEFGPRTPGSEGHQATLSLIFNKLKQNKWETSIQSTTMNGIPIENVVAKMGEGEPWIILGSHYDSRIYADQDPNPENQRLPVPGANDGASSTALLIELSRVIPKKIKYEVWLVFFDAEDNGGIGQNDWLMGSTYFVSQLSGKPDVAIIVDMIGDRDLNLYYEMNSTPNLSMDVWATANELGYQAFIPTAKFRMLDDHIPFLEAGIPSIDIIDFDYPYWHTTQDTIDKISSESLESVGRTLLKWLEMNQK